MVTIDIYTAEQQILVCIEFLLRFVYSSQLPLKVPTLHQSWGRAHVNGISPHCFDGLETEEAGLPF